MAQQGQDPQGFPKLDIKAARALNPHTRTIQIQSILGGHSPLTNFSAKDQFTDSFGIDPSEGINDNNYGNANPGNVFQPSGLLRPSSLYVQPPLVTNSLISIGTPTYFTAEPKLGKVYVAFGQGSVYTYNTGTEVITALAAGGFGEIFGGSGSLIRSQEYYDNYIYYAVGTDILRYGPLDGSADFTAAYWTSTLGKAALTDTGYPFSSLFAALPNHPMHRHSDGKLYIGDVSGNIGVLHTISTSKTAVEGDTDNGSTFGKLQFGYGFWPTAIESYGSQLVVAIFEGRGQGAGASVSAKRAKLLFWDTTSQNFNQITSIEFPDEVITALKNINGVLHIFSCPSAGGFGTRISRYVGGYSVSEVVVRYDITAPTFAAVDGDANNLYFATTLLNTITASGERGAVYALGLSIPGTQGKLFNLGGSPSAASKATIGTGLGIFSDASRAHKKIMLALGNVSDTTIQLVQSKPSSGAAADYSLISRSWTSQKYIIGQPFKITKIRLSLSQKVSGNIIVTPVFYTDDKSGNTYTGGTSNGIGIINNSNYPGKKNIVMRPENLTADYNFQFELQWTGADLCVVSLPITIEYELIPD